MLLYLYLFMPLWFPSVDTKINGSVEIAITINIFMEKNGAEVAVKMITWN